MNQFSHSITASTSPPLTVAPTSTFTVTTFPARGDFISFCIFIASTTTMPSPASTSGAGFDQHAHNLSGHGGHDPGSATGERAGSSRRFAIALDR